MWHFLFTLCCNMKFHLILSILILMLVLKVNQYSKKYPIKNKWMSYWAMISSIFVIIKFLLLFLGRI
jgi:hypothetical protein